MLAEMLDQCGGLRARQWLREEPLKTQTQTAEPAVVGPGVVSGRLFDFYFF